MGVPTVTSAVSNSGTVVEVFFSEAMTANAALTTAGNYTLTPDGNSATATVTSVSAQPGNASVLVTHNGTTLGGTYTATVVNVISATADPIDLANNTANFLARGTTPALSTVTVVDGENIRLEFNEDLLTQAQWAGGVETSSNYAFTTTYPVTIVPSTFTHPVSSNSAHVQMKVSGLTATTYTAKAGPALAYNYTGTELPSANATLTGTEQGTGTSSISGGLLLNAELGNSYGWKWAALVGKWPSNGTYRMDFTFNPNAAAHYPQLYDATYGTLTVSDGVRELTLTFKSAGGTEQITVASGAYSSTSNVTWSAASAQFSVVRNQKANTYTFMKDGLPFANALTTALTGADSIGAGVQFKTSGNYRTYVLPITQVKVTASTTLFTRSYNPVHEVTADFTPTKLQATKTRDWFYTQHGPLVKNWGDATPAAKGDVTVKLNGTTMAVSDVNPYTGKVTLETPIPLLPAGELEITADYTWQHTPVFDIARLNRQGLVLNKWDQKGTPTPDQASPDATGELGHSPSRFPFGLVLGGKRFRPHVKAIGHRYKGTEKAYSAVLNRPKRLVLNRSPHKVALDTLYKPTPSSQQAYEADAAPTSPWVLTGADTGSAGTDGTYTLIDAGSGAYPADSAAYYYDPHDLSSAGSVDAVARYKVSTYTADGVFTGVGFGLHDNRRLYLVGSLVINGLKHTGLASDATRLDERQGWILGPTATATLTSTNTCTIPTSSWPSWAKAGTKFQVFDHLQAAVYAVGSFTADAATGLTTITLSTATGNQATWPADKDTYLAQSPVLVFETDWAVATTYRLATAYQSGTATVTIGNWPSITASSSTTLPQPFQTTFVFDTSLQGQVFWGSVSRKAVNTSTWSFYRYSHLPAATELKAQNVTVQAELGDHPGSDPNSPFYSLTPSGHAAIDATADQLVFTRWDDTAGRHFGYARQEPLFIAGTYADVDTKWQEHHGTVPGSARLEVQDGQRQVMLGTLLYVTDAGTRKLVNLPQQTAGFAELPTAEGWTASNTFTITAALDGRTLVTTQAANTSGTYTYTLTGSPAAGVGKGCVYGGRVAVSSYTAEANGDIGVVLAGNGYSGFNLDSRLTLRAAVGATPAKVVLHHGGSETSWTFNWDDNVPHNFQVELVPDEAANPDECTATVIADDTTLGSVTYTAPFNTTTAGAYFGHTGSKATTAVWHGFFWHAQPDEANVGRTLGFWRGHLSSSETDIDNWVIPRTDGLMVLNSSTSATPVAWDWRSMMQVRVYLDPSYGAMLFRPDLAMPAGYNGDLSAYVTYTTNPTAAWMSVEYKQLPASPQTYGKVVWGATSSTGVSKQRWAYFRYRLFNNPTDDEINPQWNVLNRYHYIDSGELGTDITLETVTIATVTSTLVLLSAADITALRVFTVTVNGSVLASSAWTFDKVAQSVTLVTPVTTGTAVTITMLPGKPVTETYLKAQPVLDSVTLLNEGTPPVPKSQAGAATVVQVHGSALNNPDDVLNQHPDFVLNDPLRHLEHKDDSAALYEQMAFYEVDDAGTATGLASICEGPRPNYTQTWSGTVSVLGETFTANFIASNMGLMDLKETSPVPVKTILEIKNSGGQVIPTSEWTFDALAQTVAFDPPLPGPDTLTLIYVTDYRGATFAENYGLSLPDADFPQENVLMLSGGNTSQGGNLAGNGAAAIMHPTHSGAINRRTFYNLSMTQSLTSWTDADTWSSDDLAETLTLAPTADNVPPTAHATEASAPAGVAGTESKGKAYYSMVHPGNNPVLGPHGGLDVLNPNPVKVEILVNAALADGDTITINGNNLTARAAGAGADEFNIGGSATATATNIAAAITASATYTNVTASSAGAVVDLTGTPPALPPTFPTLQGGDGIYVTTTADTALLIYGSPYTQGCTLYGGTLPSDSYHNGSSTGVPTTGSGLMVMGGALLKTGRTTTGTMQPTQ